jgi:hypothetical protein
LVISRFEGFFIIVSLGTFSPHFSKHPLTPPHPLPLRTSVGPSCRSSNQQRATIAPSFFETLSHTSESLRVKQPTVRAMLNASDAHNNAAACAAAAEDEAAAAAVLLDASEGPEFSFLR